VEKAYTTQAGAGLMAIELKSGKIAHLSPSFQHLTSWIPVEMYGNIRLSLESRDGDEFHSFCQSVVRDAGEPYRETFLDRDNVVGQLPPFPLSLPSLRVRWGAAGHGHASVRVCQWALIPR
jgi:hypothetical protein